MKISPVLGVSNPAISRNNVVLPQPEGPKKVMNSPLPIVKVRFLSTASPSKRLET
jgi:hypothetical protein